MTEQTNTPELRFPGFNGEWRFNKLGDLTTKIGSGKTPKGGSQNYLNAGIPFLRSQNIQNGKLNLDDLVYIDSKTDETMKNSKSYFGDILLNITGASIGRSAINSIDNTHINLNQHVCIIRLKKQFSYKFLGNFLLSPRGQKKIFKAQSGGSREGLNFKEIANINLYIPDNFNEQEKLGKFFSKLDRQIKLEEEKLELLEQQKRGYMQKLFSQELRFKDKNGNKYPEWQLKNLSELGETFTGLSGKTKNDFGYGDGLFITYMNVFKNTIAKSDMVERVKIEANENQNKVQYGDILFTTSSEVPNEVGMSSIWLFNQDNVYLNSFCFGFRVVVNYIKPVYLARYLRSEEMRKTITILAQGSTRFNISKKEMMKLNIKVPYIEEQIKIDNFFNKIDTLILKQGKKIELLKQRKQGLLQKMFV